MPVPANVIPSFNLLDQPWISVERADGGVERLGILQALLGAHKVQGLWDTSPLVVVGIQRLLVAILQAALNPQKNSHLEKLWQAGRFPEGPLCSFSEAFYSRFDLFSVDLPFLQSADIPLAPAKKSKTVAYLAPEMPAGTAITHFRHGAEDVQSFCPACTASGLITLPAFATSGGAGIKPSINGVPPIYIIPGGETLFESLLASLTQPDFQPRIASKGESQAWWLRPAQVARGQEVQAVDYLYT